MSESKDSDKRNERRIRASELPESFQALSVLLPGEGIVKALTTDVSLTGFGLLIEADIENFIIGTNLVIFPLGEDRAVYGRIIYTSQINNTIVRVGLELLPSASYEIYKKVINRILQNRE